MRSRVVGRRRYRSGADLVRFRYVQSHRCRHIYVASYYVVGLSTYLARLPRLRWHHAPRKKKEDRKARATTSPAAKCFFRRSATRTAMQPATLIQGRRRSLETAISKTEGGKDDTDNQMTTITLKTVVFFGSARNVTPPWGGDSRLGDRILAWTKATLAARSESLGADTVKHDVAVLDPLEVFGPSGALSGFTGGELR